VLGEDRIAWMRELPLIQIEGAVALVHASPASCWRAPGPEAGDAELQSTYARLGRTIAVYGHIHRPFIRTVGEMVVVNSGSVGLSYDGDRRAAYLLLDDLNPTIRRVEWDLDRELAALSTCGLPHTEWTAKMLRSAAPQMP